jgi:NADH-quinone oxidoreductase subunit N
MDILLFRSFLPEIFITLSILFILLLNIFIIQDFKVKSIILHKEISSQVSFILICTLLLFLNLKIEGVFSSFIFLNDQSCYAIKIIVNLICLFVFPFLIKSFVLDKLNFFEYFIIFLFTILSTFLIISSIDLISFYLLIEIQALSFYILVGFKKNSIFSTEASLKYFIVGSCISGFFLFGTSLIYGTLGTLNFNDLKPLLSFQVFQLNFFFDSFIHMGVFLITITLLFKISCAPFHFWSPDVYEGAPLVSTIILSILPKFSFFIFFVRWLSVVQIFQESLSTFLLACGLFSVFLGICFSLFQKRIKKLIIYSSISQIGFLVCSLSCFNINGFVSLFFFLLFYIITSILIWGHFVFMSVFQNITNIFLKEYAKSIYITSLSFFGRDNILWSFSFLIFLFYRLFKKKLCNQIYLGIENALSF